ncbi:DMT family transporter [Lysobacter pythonis]|uniref:DMT family transporter n=1 Tax=Solilutibacter pythonis TaxID=2483112 RepID=A0A3M2I0B2_9GAMM|nr:DMT family transporter [Lysobacter pythonis]RMH93069.1 DMT family transporter [Lysobacter pythonis]
MRRGVLLGLAAYAAFSFSDAFIKLLKGGVPLFQLMFMGAALGLLALPFVRRPGERWRDLVRPKLPAIWWARVVCGAVNTLGALVAFTRLPMAEAFALIFLMPLFVTLLSVLVLREQVGWRRWLAVVLGFAGVLVVLRPGFRELHAGHAGAVVCGLAGATGVILVRLAGGREHRLTLYGTQLVGNLLIAGVLMWPALRMPDATQWLHALGFGLLSALGTVLLMYATLATPVNHVAPTQYSQMLWAVLLGALLFRDRVDALTWLGIAIIVGAGLFTLIGEEHVTGWWRRMRMLSP